MYNTIEWCIWVQGPRSFT